MPAVSPSELRVSFFRHLDTVGDGSGTKDMSADHSGAAEECKLVPQGGEIFILERVIIHVTDGSMLAANFGALTALTNGVKFSVERGGVERLDLMDGITVKTNDGWARLCHDVSRINWGSGDDTLSVRWTLSASGQPIGLWPGDEFICTINDNLSNLTDMYVFAQGYVLNSKVEPS